MKELDIDEEIALKEYTKNIKKGLSKIVKSDLKLVSIKWSFLSDKNNLLQMEVKSKEFVEEEFG